ncbi:ABC transporter ATP-binding protein [Xylophilus sp. GW821-FHT01B05]
MKPLLQVRNLSLSFRGLKAVADVSFDVLAGQIVGLIGPNGAGKSSLLNCLSRIYAPSSGAVAFEGVNLLSRPIHALAPLGIARTFQNLELFAQATVMENVLAGAIHKHRSTVFADLLRLPHARRSRQAAIAQAQALVDELGLAPFADAPVSGLAYGVQKTVELARALAGEPRLLLLDEPAAGMNPEESRQLGKTILKLRQDRGITVLMVEHDMRLVMGVCDSIVVLVQGRKLCEGVPSQIRTDPRVIEVYLGEDEQDEDAPATRDELVEAA